MMFGHMMHRMVGEIVIQVFEIIYLLAKALLGVHPLMMFYHGRMGLCN
jgi:hypothetical protein